MEIKWPEVIRDVIIVQALTALGGGVFGIVGGGRSLMAIGILGTLCGTIGFTISGCMVEANRFKHLFVVAIGVWLTSIVNIFIIREATILHWFFGILFAFLQMGLGGGLSLIFVPPPRRGRSESESVSPPPNFIKASDNKISMAWKLVLVFIGALLLPVCNLFGGGVISLIVMLIIGAVLYSSIAKESDRSLPPEPQPSLKKCPQCGASNRKAVRRCRVCGATFYEDEQAVHRAAVKALKPFDELLTVEAFTQAISDQDEIVRRRVADLLGERDDERVLEPLFHLLKDETEKVRVAAAKSLGQLGCAQAITPLLQTLDDPAVVVRRAAIDALQQWSDQKMVESLSHALTDKDATVRLKAAQLLGKLRDGRAIEPLFKLLEDAKADVRQAAVASLVQLGDEGLRPLIQTLSDLINGDAESRVQAAVALSELGDARAAGLLRCALKSEKEDHVRMAVMQSLRTLGVDPTPVLIQHLEGQRSNRTAEALIQIGKDAVDPLLQALGNAKSNTARWQILQILGKIGDTRAVPAIIKALGSSSYVKAKAAEALGVLGDPRATLPLVKLLEETSTYPTREAAIQALIQLNDEQVIEPLVGLLESPKREYAIRVLQGMGDAGTQALIRAYKNTKDRETRKTVGEALGDRKPKRGLFG